MTDHQLVIDHVHVISRDPAAAVSWYVDKLGGKIVNEVEVQGAPQIFVELGGMAVAIRGHRTGEKVEDKKSLEWGIDHFGFRVDGDFEAYCDSLKANGVEFTVEPKVFTSTTKIAFIQAPDGVLIELLHRS
jgi:catechol 2,3-dioxygenase-like lactoylglutathione lyase family enzyme